MNSILLLELSMKGRKVYTYRPNSKKEFIGDVLKMTYPLQDKEIIDLMNSKRHIKFKNYTH